MDQIYASRNESQDLPLTAIYSNGANLGDTQ